MREGALDLINCPDCGRTARGHSNAWVLYGFSCIHNESKRFRFCTEDKCQTEITYETAGALITHNYAAEHWEVWEGYCTSHRVSFFLWRPLITTANESYCSHCGKIYEIKNDDSSKK